MNNRPHSKDIFARFAAAALVVTAPAAMTRTIYFGWMAPADTSLITGYTLAATCRQPDNTYQMTDLDAGNKLTGTMNLSGQCDVVAYSYSTFFSPTAYSGPSDPVSFDTATLPDTIPPTPPSMVVTNLVPPDAINIQWAGATDNVGVLGYLVERCEGKGCGDYDIIAQTPYTSYADYGLAGGLTYRYRVTSYDAANNASAPSLPASNATPDVTSPPPPTFAPATPVSPNEIRIDVIPPSDQSNVAAIIFARCTGRGCTDFVKVGQVLTTPRKSQYSYSDGYNLLPSTYYRYKIMTESLARIDSSPVYSGTTTPPSP